MRLYRFLLDGQPRYGILKEENLFFISGSIFDEFEVLEESVPVAAVRILAPVLPSKIVGIGLNYRDHALERKRSLPEVPLIFLKAPSALNDPGEAILYPEMSSRVDFEGELAVVMKKKARRLGEDSDAGAWILGYTCFNDVTARDLQEKDGQFTRAKSFDTFACAGPCIATDVRPDNLGIKTFLNGKLRQSSNTRNLIFSVPDLVRFISRVMTLLPGDIITTGTPAGVGPMNPGDRVDVQIEGIGTLSNIVAKAGGP